MTACQKRLAAAEGLHAAQKSPAEEE